MKLPTLAGLWVLVALIALPLYTHAQSFECDDRFGECGTPDLSGGGDGGGGGSILIANTDLGDTYQFADDYDNDGREDPYDNCVRDRNYDQTDSDGDGIGDACDNCLNTANRDQSDLDGDRYGDLCDDDMDHDEIDNVEDNCPKLPNPPLEAGKDQPDQDEDGIGDACDLDIDGDGLDNLVDECPMLDQEQEAYSSGDECRPDSDGDGISDILDLCLNIYDPEQLDIDGDGRGDACDSDMDGDNVTNQLDNCPEIPNSDQLDNDRDGEGDACDSDGFCYVIFGDRNNCLDPEASLKVYAPPLLGEVKKSIRLAIFLNRNNQPLTYVWTVEKAPANSDSTVSNAKGIVEKSIDYEYVYPKDNIPSFKPDVPGEYHLRITVTAHTDILTNELDVIDSHLATIIAEDNLSDVLSWEQSSTNQNGVCSVSGYPITPMTTKGLLVILAILTRLVFRRLRHNKHPLSGPMQVNRSHGI